MNQTKLQWKKLSNTSLHQILFDKENEAFLQNILSHKITEFEVDNLPSSYIISFIQVLQNYIFYYIQKNYQNMNIIIKNTDNFNNIDEIITSKNEQIENLKKKLFECEEIIVRKDKLLNDTNKKLYSLYNQYCKMQKEYKLKIEKYKDEMKEREENFKEMDDKLIDTFQYLNQLFMISNEGIIFDDKKQSPKKSNININPYKLNTNRTFNQEPNRHRGDLMKRDFPYPLSTKILNKVYTERSNIDKNRIIKK